MTTEETEEDTPERKILQNTVNISVEAVQQTHRPAQAATPVRRSRDSATLQYTHLKPK